MGDARPSLCAHHAAGAFARNAIWSHLAAAAGASDSHLIVVSKPLGIAAVD